MPRGIPASQGICITHECERLARSLGLCHTCYMYQRRTGEAPERRPTRVRTAVDICVEGSTAYATFASGITTVVDADMVGLIRDHSWAARLMGRRWYVSGELGLLHRVVLGLEKGDPMFGDHIDGDGLNNRRANLRPVTAAQNAMNRRHRVGSQWAYKGISASGFGWRAQINVDGRRIRSDPFPSQQEAARAYDDMARRHFGDFAWLNFPED